MTIETCKCWSCFSQCGGTADTDSCGPLADVDGLLICEVCRSAADVFGADRVGAQVTLNQGQIRLMIRWAGHHDQSIWMDAASARHLASVLTERAGQLEASE